MIPILFQTLTEGTVPTHYGLGALTDALACTVKEERNGSYELSLTYAASGIHAEDIQPNRFIMAKPNYTDNAQIFRIYKVGKTINGRFEVSAQHISYDLSGKIITSGTASSCVAACALLQAQAGSFTINTDKTVSASFKVANASSVRSWFGGKAGSLLDVYGGEWKYDNYTASLKQARGANRGVTIRYGKNLTQLSQILDMSNLVTAIVPYYINPDGVQTVGTKVNTGLTLDVPREVAIDFSQEVDPESGTAITTQLANLANRYKNNNNLTTLANSITLDFVQSGELTERVDLCDTVSIYFEALGLTASAKCVATVWDVLAERYTSTTFGEARTNIADTIAQSTKKLAETPSTSFMSEAIAHATELITGNLGGYVILHDSNGDDYPDELLIMDTADISTATKVWRFNKGGLGYSPNGYAGPYSVLALTSDGEIVADAITTGTLNANLIKAGIIEDVGHNSTINMTNGAAVLNQLKAKTNLTLIDTNNVMRAAIGYTAGSGTAFRAYHSNGTAVASVDCNVSGYGMLSVGNSSGTQLGSIQTNSAGGHLFLGNSSGTTTITLGNISTGGTINLVNQYNKGVASLYTDNTSQGALSLSNANATLNALLGCSAYGGQLYLYNSIGNNTFSMFSGSAYQGELYVYDGSATGTIFLHGGSGNVTCVSLTQTSSRKVKENIKPIEDAAKILELDAVSFDYKNKAQGTDRRGFIAEDVAKILPNLVTPETEETPATLDYLEIIPYLQAVIKDQQKRIKELEAVTNDNAKRIEALEAKINTLGG